MFEQWISDDMTATPTYAGNKSAALVWGHGQRIRFGVETLLDLPRFRRDNFLMADKKALQSLIITPEAERTAVSQRLLDHVRAQGGEFTRMTVEDCEEIIDILVQRFAGRDVERCSQHDDGDNETPGRVFGVRSCIAVSPNPLQQHT